MTSERAPVAPPTWTAEEFDRDRLVAIQRFRASRAEELLDPYNAAFAGARQAVAELLELTADLATVDADAVAAIRSAPRLEALRYLPCPPVSADDLKVLADVDSLAASILPKRPDDAAAVVRTVMQNLDPGRFPWVRDGRGPTDGEREAALVSTAAMIAQRRILTRRAHDAKHAQERAAKQALREAGFVEVPTRTIGTYAQAPKPGQFCGESSFFGRKADVVATLWDGRFMPVECKVSNSSTNSVKRLNNDAAAKAVHWIDRVGRDQTIPVAVLSGVFKRHNLERAQAAGLTIFWADRMEPLQSFVGAAR